jgi:hypothetical protein
MEATPKAFVIMPFDPEFKPIYEDLIKPALEDAGYEVARADSFLDQQNILRDIVQGIASADLIVADLTTLNANVFYELGLCHGLRIPTVLLTQSIEEVPFDLRSYKVQVYETRFDKIHKLKEALKDIGEKHKKREIAFGSPVIDFFPTERNFQSEKVAEAVTEESVEEQPEEFEEKGIMDYSAGIEAAFEELSRIVVEIGKENESIGNKAAGHAARLQALNANPGVGSAAQKQKIGLLIASDMNLSAKKIERELPNFEKAVNSLDEDFSGLMAFATTHASEQDKEKIINSRQILTSFLEHARIGTDSMRALRDVVAGMKGISKDVNRASRRFSQVYDSLIQNFEKVEAFGVRAISLIDQWLDEEGSSVH